MNLTTRLGGLLADIPHLPDAACKGQQAVFDLEPDADPMAIETAIATCMRCRALDRCREWVASTPVALRPSGIVAGQLLPAPAPPTEPDTATGTGRAIVFLTERLRGGPLPVAELITEAAAIGLTRRNLGHAAAQMNLTRMRLHHRSFQWALPATA